MFGRRGESFFRSCRTMALAALAVVMAAGLIAVQNDAAKARGEAGDFDYYTLALSWSPTYCKTNERARNSEQCDARKPYTFILHGLWPQWYKGWPEFCRTRGNSWVPNELIREMMDIMPGKGLIIHQYKKHGSCSGMSPEQYFSVARKLYESVRIPEIFGRRDAPVSVTPDEVERAFLAANPQLQPDMLAVSCRRDLVEEVRICFGRDQKPRTCGRNEDQSRLCRTDRLTMPPAAQTSRPEGI